MNYLKFLKSLIINGTSRLFFIIIAAIIILPSSEGCGRKDVKEKTRPAAEVTTMKISPADTPVTFEFVAQTQSSHQVEIRARVNGFLEKRIYTEGSVVKAGSVLFVMDKKPFQTQVNAAAAALSRQQATYETARMNLDRVKPLAEQNALSQKDLDDAKGSYESAAAAVEQAKAQLESEKLNLSYCTITSPVTGVSGAAMVQDGAYINQMNNQLTTVAVLSPIWVNFSMSENDIKKYADKIAAGKIIPPKNENYEVEVVLVDGSIFSQKGMITFADPSFNVKTGTFLVRASVKNPDGLLRPNQYVRARLKGAIRRNGILIPQRAIQQGAKGHFVWVVDNERKAELRPVIVDEWHDNDVFIDQGLHAGDEVVVDGILGVRQGEPLTAKPLANKTPSSAPPGGENKPGSAKSNQQGR